VVPALGLSAGTHTATVTVSGGSNIEEQSFEVNFYVIAATYGVTLSRNGTGLGADYTHSFGTVTLPNYTLPAALAVTVTNSGNQATGTLTVALGGTNNTAFTVAPTTITGLAVNGSDSFTVQPKPDLGAGTYTATVTVSGGNGISASFGVSFVVEAVTYSISLDVSGTHIFPDAVEGYPVQGAKTVNITNTGNQPTGNLTVTLTNANPANIIAFTLSSETITTIGTDANNKTATFTVQPKPDLDAGTYTATVSVSGGTNIETRSFGVSFVVNPPPISENSYLTLTDGTTSVEFGVSDLPALCTMGISSTSITLNGQSIVKNTIKKVVIGSAFSGVTALPDMFCRNFSNMTELDISGFTGLASIGTFFLDSCLSFNQPFTLPSTVTGIGRAFLWGCTAFDQSITLPPGLTSIGNSFLKGCEAFNQPLDIPEGVTSIDASFLHECTAFNQPLDIPEGVTSIGNFFMDYCTSFNQPLVIPEGVTSIGNNFMADCYVFNQPLVIPEGVTSIGNFFVADCYAFNQPLVIPNGVTSIGPYFLRNSSAFNQPLVIPNGVTSIGTAFLSGCTSFNQPLDIPNGVTSIDNAFLRNCDSLVSAVTVRCPATAFVENNYSYQNFATGNAEAPCYTMGIPIAGPSAAAIMAKFPTGTAEGLAGTYYRKLIAAQ
jgi:methionine-rich copper-binding protein CopC